MNKTKKIDGGYVLINQNNNLFMAMEAKRADQGTVYNSETDLEKLAYVLKETAEKTGFNTPIGIHVSRNLNSCLLSYTYFMLGHPVMDPASWLNPSFSYRSANVMVLF